MRVGLDKTMILETAGKLADAKGVSNVTLKALAEELGVKSPSLYKHISGLDELNKELMLYGWKSLEKEMSKVAIGKSKDDAIIAICYAYRDYVALHPGIFEAMLWYNMYQSEEHLEATADIVSILFQILDGYDLKDEQKIHIVRMLRGFLQGFLTVESHGGYGNPMSISDSFDFSLKIILNGIHNLQRGKMNEKIF